MYGYILFCWQLIGLWVSFCYSRVKLLKKSIRNVSSRIVRVCLLWYLLLFFTYSFHYKIIESTWKKSTCIPWFHTSSFNIFLSFFLCVYSHSTLNTCMYELAIELMNRQFYLRIQITRGSIDTHILT
jgi:hypothetical protein